MTTEKSEPTSEKLAELYQDAPGEHGVRIVRDMSSDEVAEVNRAHDLISTTANAAPWHRCREVFGVVIGAIAELKAADPAGPGELARLRSGLASLAEALRRLADKLEEAVREFGDEQAANSFQEYAEQARGSPAWSQVAGLADAEAGSFKRAPSGQVVWEGTSDEAVVDPTAVASAAMNVGQSLFVRQCNALGPALTDAAERLRRLSVEAPAGTPGIVEIDLEADQPLEHFKPRALALDRVVPALRAARIATRVVGEYEAGQESAADPLAEEEEQPADETADLDLRDAKQPEGGEAEFGASGTDGGSDQSGNEPDVEEGAGADIPLPVEFSSLFSLARNIDSDLEKVWSAALDETLLDAAVEKQLAAVGTLLSALQRKVANQEQSLEAAGVNNRITEWPLSDETISQLSLSDDVASRTRQSTLAQLDALLAVAQTFEELTERPNVTITIDQSGESVERFWSAGAFALLKDRLWLLERMTRVQERNVAVRLREADASAVAESESSVEEDPEIGQAEEAVEESPSDEETERRSDGFERLRLGTRAWLHGDPEAAMVHAVVGVAATLGVTLDQMAAVLNERVKGGEPGLTSEQVAILSLAAEHVRQSLSGHPDVTAATLLARAALQAAQVTILGPVPTPDLSTTEIAELIESRQPLQPLEPEDDGEPA